MKILSNLLRRRFLVVTAALSIAALAFSARAGAQEKEPYRPEVVFKVNTVTLPLLVANVGVEVSPVSHFSISLPA